MRTRAVVAALVASLFTLSACGGSDNATNPQAALRVGVSPVPHAKILNYVAKELAPAKNLKIEVVEIQDYVVPNTSLVDKQLEANFFQHKPYLDKFTSDRSVDLRFIAPVHIEPLAVFSQKIKSLAELPQNGSITVSDDAANQTRALNLLAGNGIITLKPGTEKAAGIDDIATNPKNLRFTELAPAQLPRSLPDTDAAVINGNYALDAGLDPIKGSLAVEKADGNPYANGLVTRPELADDPRIKTLVELLTSAQTKEFITKNFSGAVIPA